MIKNLFRIFKITALSFLLLMAASGPLRAQDNQSDFEISKNLDIFVTLYKQLHLNYVDKLNSGELMKTAIDAMLESLDPYTVYIPESDIEEYRFMTTGQYGGIGAGILKRGHWVYISEPYQGFPADVAGLRAGDKIVEINGKSAKDKTVDDISTALKGQPGTEVTILIERDSTEKAVEKVVTRKEIKVENVPYFGIVGDHIAYINLSEFRQNAAKEVRDAFVSLNDKRDIKGVIIDLRGNGGGLLNEAVNIVNIFVDKGQLVVSTRGKIENKDNYHKTLNPAVDKEIPLAVLVDGGSASASEIVAGSLQDLDRAVIIGERTYGKGLVQNIIPLTYNAELKVTIAKYYIPSGRCIQELDYAHKDEEGHAVKFSDSTATAFKTLNGRVVYDRGGIEPDINVKPEEISNIAFALADKLVVFDYATYFFKNHASIPPAGSFVITEEIYNDFLNFIKGKEYDYKTASEEALETLKASAEKEKYFDGIRTEYDALKEKMMRDKEADLTKNKEQIKRLIKAYILPRYYYQKGRIEGSLSDDPCVLKAIEVLTNPAQYKSILKISSK
jgi:carboxyl-terminal processing protease